MSQNPGDNRKFPSEPSSPHDHYASTNQSKVHHMTTMLAPIRAKFTAWQLC